MVVVKLQLWDLDYPQTGCLDSSYYNDSAAFLLAFDLHNQQSFDFLNIQIKTIRQSFDQCPVYIVGTKSDLIDEQEGRISEENILLWVRENNIDAYFKVSARTGENISRLFEILTHTLVQNQITQGKALDDMPRHFKIIVEGMDGVGKTSIIRRLLIERGVPEDQAQYFKETYDIFIPISQDSLTYPTDANQVVSLDVEKPSFEEIEKLSSMDHLLDLLPNPQQDHRHHQVAVAHILPEITRRGTVSSDTLRTGINDELNSLFKKKNQSTEEIFREIKEHEVSDDIDDDYPIIPSEAQTAVFKDEKKDEKMVQSSGPLTMGVKDEIPEEEEEVDFHVMKSSTSAEPAIPAKPNLSPIPEPPEPKPVSEMDMKINDVSSVNVPKTKKKAKRSVAGKHSVMASREETALVKYTKNLSVEYFDRMNPENYYPLTLDIANIKQAVKATRENVVTGERFTQKQEEVVVELKSSEVTVVPIFPGCNVTPAELIADFKKPEEKLTFYITPIVKGDLEECRIELLDDKGRKFYELKTPAKVDDPRIARAIATYGTFISVFPKLLELFEIDIGAVNSTPVTSYIPQLEFLGEWKMANFISLLGASAAVIIGLIVHRIKQPKSTVRTFQMKDLAGYLGELI